MRAAVVNITDLTRGDDWSLTVRFWQADGTTPINLTGRVFAAQFRESEDAAAMVPFTVDLTHAATGEVTVSMSHTLTAALRRDGVWDFQQTRSGQVLTLLRGRVSVIKDVTRP